MASPALAAFAADVRAALAKRERDRRT